jgi:hypothetical protein
MLRKSSLYVWFIRYAREIHYLLSGDNARKESRDAQHGPDQAW